MLTILRKVTLYGTALFILLFILSILVAMVVDLLFPGTTDIVANLSNLVNQFMNRGLAGLVVFIIVIAIIGRVLYRAYKEFRR